MKALLKLLRISKKKKSKEGQQGEGALPTLTADNGTSLPEPSETVVGQEGSCALPPSMAEVQAGAPAASVDVTPGGAELSVPHEKLLAALESVQNTSPACQEQVSSAQLGFVTPDLSGMLFAQRTNTQSGTGMAMPARLAEGAASGVNDGEAAANRLATDAVSASYVPYMTTTVAPAHSAANNTNQDSTALHSNTQNLQDILYVDYDALDRLQARQDRVVGGFSSALPRRDARPPAVPSNPALKSTPQLPQLPAVQALKASAAAAMPSGGAPVTSAYESAPLVHLQQASQDGCNSRPLPQPQQQADLSPGGNKLPSTPRRQGQELQQGPSSGPPGPRARSPLLQGSVQLPQVEGTAEGPAARSMAAKLEQPLLQQPLPSTSGQAVGFSSRPDRAAPDSAAPLQPAAPPRATDGGSAAGSPPGAEPAHVAAASSPPLIAPGAVAPGGTAPTLPDGRVVRSAVAEPPAAVPAAPLPPTHTGVHGQQPAPLSRPLKLTTACLGAHTTLCDSAADQSFQRALQRKMQMVFKWLHASDLTSPPDPRLEVPVAQDAADLEGEGSVLEAGALQQSSVQREAAGTGGAHAHGGAAQIQPGAAVAGRGGPGTAPAYTLRPPRGPPLLTSEEIAALEAKASASVAASRTRHSPAAGQHATKPAHQQQQQQPEHCEQQVQRQHQRQPQQEQQRQQTSQPAADPAAPADNRVATATAAGGVAVSSQVVGGTCCEANSFSGGECGAVEAQQRGAHTQGAFRVLQGGELPAASGHKEPGDPVLHHSLSDLYISGQAAVAANLPPRVLAGSDEAIAGPAPVAPAATVTAAAPAQAIAAGAAAMAANGAAAAGADADAAREFGEPVSQTDFAPNITPASLRPAPGAVPPARTKTIAVASHCPADLQPQPPSAAWSIDDFTLLKKLYEGSLSVVCQAQHKRSKRHVALKIYKRSRLQEMERFQLAREICLHIRIVHPHVVALYAAWKDSKYVYLALEWAPQGNMFDFLVSRGGRLGEEEAARVVIKPLFSALAFLHGQQFIHRDVKLENLVLDGSWTLKLADFGLAIDQKFEQANTRLGTFGYFAPEVLDCPLKKGPFDLKDASVPGYDNKIDVWSAGVVCYEVLTGRAPFSASSPAKIIQAIRTRVLEFPGVSEDGIDFLRSALMRDPAARPTAKQLLNHPWLLRHCGGVGSATSPRGTLAAAIAVPLPLPEGEGQGRAADAPSTV